MQRLTRRTTYLFVEGGFCETVLPSRFRDGSEAVRIFLLVDRGAERRDLLVGDRAPGDALRAERAHAELGSRAALDGLERHDHQLRIARRRRRLRSRADEDRARRIDAVAE